MYNDSQNKATQKYIKSHLDTICFRVKKGERDKYKQIAEHHGLSLAELIRKAIEEYAENHANE